MAPLGRVPIWFGRAAEGARAVGRWIGSVFDEFGRVSQFGPDAETRIGRDAGSRC